MMTSTKYLIGSFGCHKEEAKGGDSQHKKNTIREEIKQPYTRGKETTIEIQGHDL